ncbi:hypothetical protein P2318_23785 [Myxococcaceae bacterium GXIMD 01537]
MANPGAFDKDLGYLMPFLDRVAAAAATLEDPAARGELERLLAGEKARWERVRELLGGASGEPGPTPAQAAVPERAPAPAPSAHRATQTMTVGSLRGSR